MNITPFSLYRYERMALKFFYKKFFTKKTDAKT